MRMINLKNRWFYLCKYAMKNQAAFILISKNTAIYQQFTFGNHGNFQTVY
jgi:hypothetical protein